MTVLTDTQLREQLDNMRRQEQALLAQIDHLQNQLQMTRGAVQMLEHLVRLADKIPDERLMDADPPFGADGARPE